MKRAFCLFMVILLLMPLALSGCKVIRGNGSEFCINFLDYIRQKDYEKAYNLLPSAMRAEKSSSTTDKDGVVTNTISLKDFKDKYTAIFDAMELVAMEYSVNNISDGSIVSSVDFTMSYYTDKAGILTDLYTITAEYHGGWQVMWHPNLIFPAMQWGDKLLTGLNYPARGEIFDADGKLLAENISPLTVFITPASLKDDEDRARLRAELLAVPEIAAKFKDAEALDILDRRINSKMSSANVISVYPDSVPDDFIDRVLAIDGVGIDKKSALTTTDLRNYPFDNSLCHILGFASIVQKEDLKELKKVGGDRYDPFYDGDSWLGYSGMEMQYELRLRGEKGSFAYIQGSDGSNRKTLYNIPAKDGEDIHLTVKMDLQKRVEEVVKTVSYTGRIDGVCIVMNPLTCAVEALYSWPDYNPNEFSRGLISEEKWEEMENDPKAPMLNRAIQGLYAPGSTFKVLTGSLGIDSGTIGWDTVFPEDTEEIKWDVWYPSRKGEFMNEGIEKVTRTGNSNRHTPMNLENSIIDSDNIFFSWTALKMGWQKFLQGMKTIGMEEAIPFDLPVQPAQMYADEETELTPTLLTMTGYGQGEILVSPLQMACYVAGFRTGGITHVPYIVGSFWQANGTDYTQVESRQIKEWKRICTPDTAARMEQAMIGVCKNRWNHGGTGRYLNVNSFIVAGKTGTAEVGHKKEKEMAWFIGYRRANADGSPLAPEDERLVLVMLEFDMNNLPNEFSMEKFLIAQMLLKDDSLTETPPTNTIFQNQ